jgi:hypothetical protein
LPVVQLHQVDPVKQNRSFRRIQQSQNGSPDRGFTATGLPDQSERPAAADIK